MPFDYSNLEGKTLGFGILERLSGYVLQIDADHVHVHNGIVFQNVQSNAAIANAGTILFEIIVPTNTYLHFKGLTAWVTNEHWSIELIGNPTLTTGVTTIPNYPFQYPAIVTPTVVVKSNPTGISGGDAILPPFYFGGGSGVGQAVSSSVLNKDFEHLLGTGTYLVRVTNLTGGEEKGAFSIIWYQTPTI